MMKFQPFQGDAIYTPNEVAMDTPFTEKTLAKWRWLGTGPEYHKLHGRIFYRGAALNGWLASAERGGTPSSEAA